MYLFAFHFYKSMSLFSVIYYVELYFNYFCFFYILTLMSKYVSNHRFSHDMSWDHFEFNPLNEIKLVFIYQISQ